MIAIVRRMAHNPPIPARLDFMDRLGMLALDENRDYVRLFKHEIMILEQCIETRVLLQLSSILVLVETMIK